MDNHANRATEEGQSNTSPGNSSHDPLCQDDVSDDDWKWVAETIPAAECNYCRLIARVRADEREQAAQRVAALCAHTKYVGCQPCIHDECADAARGENQ